MKHSTYPFLAYLAGILSLVFCTGILHAQTSDRTITGIVVDEQGVPLPAAHVQQVSLVSGEELAAVTTDLNGHFRLTLSQTAKEIQVSFVGYTTKHVKLDNETSYRITLEPSAELIDEVVVTGYQTISRERTTGAFAKVNAKQLESQRLNDMESLIEGRVAGYSEGKIRGITSMNGLTTPLYVINGFPVEKTTNDGYGNWVEGVPDINMEDIESITVLKDAAATSIYGARAANGVIVITTKKAAKGTTEVAFSTTLSVRPYTSVANHYLANAATMIGLEREWAEQNPNLHSDNAQAYAQGLLNNMTYPTGGIRNLLNYYAGNISQTELEANLENLAQSHYRYYNDIARYTKRNELNQQYNLSLRKESDKNSFSASLTYKSDNLEDLYSDNRDLSFNLQNTTELTSWLTLELGTYLNYGSGTTQSFDPLSPGYTYMPYDELVDSNGNPYTNTEADRYSQADLNTLHSNGLYNLDITPLDEMGWNLTHNKNFSNRTFARLAFKLTDWLRYTASFQYEYADYSSEQLKNKESFEVRNRVNGFATSDAQEGTVFNLPYGNMLKNATNRTHAYNFRQQLDFNYTFGKVHNVTLILGTETRENKLDYDDRTLYNFDPDLLTYTMIDANTLNKLQGLWGWASFTQNDVASVRQLINRYVSVYSNAAYTFNDKYALTGSIRWDKTNLFSTGSKYQKKPIWSVGAAWNIDRESFINLDWLNMLKLRTSYGIGGNIAKDSAPYMTAYYGNNTHVGGITGTIGNRPNPDLRWEKTTTFNVGLDFSLLTNRLNGTLEFYNKLGSDLLANTNGVPTEGMGFSTYTINNGRMTNRGFEVTLSADVIRSSAWNWNVSGVLGYNKNKVTYVNVEAPVSYLLIDYPSAYPRIGNPYNAIYGYQWAGLSAEGTPQVYDSKGNLFTDMEPSELEDLIYLGTTVPIYSGSISTNLSYRNWELAAQFLFEGGHKMRNTNLAYLSGMAPVSKQIEDRWQNPGDEAHTDIPRYISNENPLYNYNHYNMYSRSSVNVIDATNWKLDKLSLIYRIPNEVCQKIHLRNARIMLGMENVWTFARSTDAKYLLGGYVKPTYLCGIYLNF